ncbi:MAG TPA: FecR domain-containing protein [Fodinibius sp.]|nr:FecR domain-containing protein [Fodinibius sp.]
MKSSTNNAKPGNRPNDFDAMLEQAAAADDKFGLSVTADDTAAAFGEVARQVGIEQAPSSRGLRTWLYAAAALFLIGAIGLGYLATPNRISVPDGSIRTAVLPDQSTVTLNGGSELTYARWFNFWGRTVRLEGEAFFDVRSSEAPFKVKAGPGLITVTGTKFNVDTQPARGQSQTVVYLEEGQVRFSAKNQPESSVVLAAGQISRLLSKNNNPTPPKTADSSKATAWMNQSLIFEGQPLSAVFDEISRRFGVQIHTETQNILNDTLTIYLSKVNSAEQVLSDICRAQGLSYRKDGDTFIVSQSY